MTELERRLAEVCRERGITSREFVLEFFRKHDIEPTEKVLDEFLRLIVRGEKW